MNVILSLFSLKESWNFFQKSVFSLPALQKKIGIIAAIAFSAIAIVYVFCRCGVADHHVVQVKKEMGKDDSNDSILSDSMNSEPLKLNSIPIDEDQIFDDSDRLVGNTDTPYIDEPINLVGSKPGTGYQDSSMQCNLTKFFLDET